MALGLLLWIGIGAVVVKPPVAMPPRTTEGCPVANTSFLLSNTTMDFISDMWSNTTDPTDTAIDNEERWAVVHVYGLSLSYKHSYDSDWK